MAGAGNQELMTRNTSVKPRGNKLQAAKVFTLKAFSRRRSSVKYVHLSRHHDPTGDGVKMLKTTEGDAALISSSLGIC